MDKKKIGLSTTALILLISSVVGASVGLAVIMWSSNEVQHQITVYGLAGSLYGFSFVDYDTQVGTSVLSSDIENGLLLAIDDMMLNDDILMQIQIDGAGDIGITAELMWLVIGTDGGQNSIWGFDELGSSELIFQNAIYTQPVSSDYLDVSGAINKDGLSPDNSVLLSTSEISRALYLTPSEVGTPTIGDCNALALKFSFSSEVDFGLYDLQIYVHIGE